MKCLTAYILTAFLALAVVAPAHATMAPQVREDITTASEKVLKAVNESRDTYNNAKLGALADELITILEPVVDFEAIAKSVMGKHATKASGEQKERFKGVFKRTMGELYAKSLLSINADEISLGEPNVEMKSDKMAKVRMKVTASKKTDYTIYYYMLKNGSKNKWQIRNVVLDGINLGLTYRNQFDSAMNSYDGDIDAVINKWESLMDG